MRIKHILALFLFGIFLCLIHPSVDWKDSGLLISSAFTLGIAQPPGHPLFCMLGKTFSLIPLGSAALKLNLLSASVCAGIFYLFSGVLEDIEDMSFPRRASSQKLHSLFPPFAAFLFCISQIMLSQASSAETYALELLLLMTALKVVTSNALTASDGSAQGRAHFCLFGFFAGLGMANHTLLTLCLVLPMALFLFVRGKNRIFGAVLWTAVFFIAGLSLYLYLPLRAAQDPAVYGGFPDSWARFAWVIRGANYSQFLFSFKTLYSNYSFENFLKISFATARFLFDSLYWVWAALAVAGAFIIVKRRRFFGACLILPVFAALGVIYWWSFSTGYLIQSAGDMGYYLLPLALLYLLGALGLFYLLHKLDLPIKPASMKAFVWVFASVLWALHLAGAYSYGLSSSRATGGGFGQYFWGRAVLDSVQHGGIYLPASDSGYYVPLYLSVCARYRPDVSIMFAGELLNERGRYGLKRAHPHIFPAVAPNASVEDGGLAYHLKALERKHFVYTEPYRYEYIRADFYPQFMLLGAGKNADHLFARHMRKTEGFLGMLGALGFYDERSSDDDYYGRTYRIGGAFFLAGDFGRALEHFKLLYGYNEEDTDTASAVLYALVSQSRWPEAKDFGSRILSRGIKNPFIYYNYALSLIYSGKKDEALKVIAQAKDLFKGSSQFDELNRLIAED